MIHTFDYVCLTVYDLKTFDIDSEAIIYRIYAQYI